MLSISLYGCETWSLTEVLNQRLRGMHAQHLRAMCRVTRTHTWQHHLSTQELGQRLGLDPIDTYVARRQLRWVGHVSRMDHETRLPRRMLSSWVPQRRPTGAPTMTYGRSIFKAMEKFNIDSTRWHELASDRAAWRETLRTGLAPPAFRPHARPPSPRISRNKNTRTCTRATMAAINASLRDEFVDERALTPEEQQLTRSRLNTASSGPSPYVAVPLPWLMVSLLGMPPVAAVDAEKPLSGPPLEEGEASPRRPYRRAHRRPACEDCGAAPGIDVTRRRHWRCLCTACHLRAEAKEQQ